MTPDEIAAWDPQWDDIPRSWGEGPWSGNGLLGALGYVRPDQPNCLRIETGHATACMARPGRDLADSCRIPVGHIELAVPSDITGGFARQHLDQGLWTISAVYAQGTTTVTVCVLAHRDAILISWQGKGSARFIPARAIPDHDRSIRRPCPPPQLIRKDDLSTIIQPTDPQGAIVSAWRCQADEHGGRLALSMAVDAEDGTLAPQKTDTEAQWRADDEQLHQAWWHRWWARWDLSLDDPQLQANAILQLAKLGSATRPGGPVCDLLGPWYRPTRWPFLFQNLNLQTTYTACAPLGLADHAQGFTGWLAEVADNLQGNVPPDIATQAAWVGSTSARDGRSQWEGCMERGNLLWHLHAWWEIAHHAGEQGSLQSDWFPLLVKALELYRHMLHEGDDGRLHLSPSRSPEYADGAPRGTLPDATYDLALLRWGLGAALAYEPTHHLAKWWQATIDRLCEPHVHPESGLMVGAGQAFEESHRHHSHIFPYHPLRLRRPDELFEKSVKNWLSKDQHLAGYSYLLGAACWALLGEGDLAAAAIRQGMDRYFQPNGLYLEPSHPYDRQVAHADGIQTFSPTIETPLIALRSSLDLLLRSDAELIELFPAIPSTWQHAQFKGLYAWGGIRIDANWAKGGTSWVRLRGSGQVRLRSQWASDPRGHFILDDSLGQRDLLIDLDQGAVEIYTSEYAPPPALTRQPWFGSPRVNTLPQAIREQATSQTIPQTVQPQQEGDSL